MKVLSNLYTIFYEDPWFWLEPACFSFLKGFFPNISAYPLSKSVFRQWAYTGSTLVNFSCVFLEYFWRQRNTLTQILPVVSFQSCSYKKRVVEKKSAIES